MPEREHASELPARLTLWGYAPAPARLHALHRPRSVRLTRATMSLVGFWALAPVVFLVPPHLPWGIGALGTGVYLAWTNWRGPYQVEGFTGECPKCGNELALKKGAKISLPHAVTCYNCHGRPFLELA